MIIRTNSISKLLNLVSGEFLSLSAEHDTVDLEGFGSDLADSIYRNFKEQSNLVPDISTECEAEFFSSLIMKLSEHHHKSKASKWPLQTADVELH